MPVAVLLLPYIVFLLFYFAYGAFIMYHLLRFGIAGTGMLATVALFIVGTVVLLAVSGIALSGYDWQSPLSIQAVPGLPGSFSPL